MKCVECGEGRARKDDPRTPPLEEGECLCISCCCDAMEEVIDELEQDLENARRALKALTPGGGR